MSTTSTDTGVAGGKPRKSTKLFYTGVLVLTFSNILIKAIGLMFKIPITNIIGDEGMGYFNAAYSIYVWFYMISTAGLPIAVSILISDCRAKGRINEVKRVFAITVMLFLLIGMLGTGIMFFGAKMFANLIGSESIYYCIMAISPTLFLICISSAIRGFFQGYQNMVPTAISQIIEAVGKLVLGIVFALYAIKQGYSLPIVAAYAISGLTIGVAVGMLFLIVCKLTFRQSVYDEEYTVNGIDETVRPSRALVWILISTAIPITISASVMSLTNMIDVMIVIRRLLSAGLSEANAVEVYGNYTSLAVPMFNLPPVLIYPISYSIIPLISSALTSGDRERADNAMNGSLKVAAIIALPSALGLSVMAKPVLSLFFRAESVESAAPLLSILALSVFFVGLLSVSNAILQANGHERKPIYSMLTGAAVKLVSSFILIGIPAVGVYGAPIGTFLCYLTITVINFRFLSKHCGVSPRIILTFVKPFIAAVVCAAAAWGANALISSIFASRFVTLLAILIAVVVYMLVLLLIRGISKEDVLMLPKGHVIYRVLKKCRLIK